MVEAAKKIEFPPQQIEEDTPEYYIYELEKAMSMWEEKPEMRIKKVVGTIEKDYASKEILDKKRFNKYRRTWGSVVFSWIRIANMMYFDDDAETEKQIAEAEKKWFGVKNVTKDMIEEAEDLARKMILKLKKVSKEEERAA